MKALFRSDSYYIGMSHIAIDARVLLTGMACILISHTLLFPMPLCALGVLLWSTRMPFVSDSSQRGKQCHILWQCNEHGLLLLPHRLLKKKKFLNFSWNVYLYIFNLGSQSKIYKSRKKVNTTVHTLYSIYMYM